MNGGENKLLLAGTKVGRMENTRSEICKLCLFTCKTATTSAGLMVCVIHKTKLCHWLLDLVAKKSPLAGRLREAVLEWKSWAFYLSHSRVSSTFLFFLPFMTHPLLREEKDHIQHLAKTQNAEIHKWYVSSWSRARLLVDKCFSDQSERQKKKNWSQKEVETICLSACVKACIIVGGQGRERQAVARW